MIPRRESSRARYRGYRERQRTDASYTKKSALDKGPDKLRRGRGFGELFRALWRLLDAHHSTIILALTTLSLVTLIGLAIPASTKIAIDYILTDHPGPAGIPEGIRPYLPTSNDGAISRETLLWDLGLFMVALAVLGVTLGTVGRFQMTRLTKRAQVLLRRLAFDHASRLPLNRIQHYKSGGMASLLRDDASQAGELLFSMIYNPWRAVIQLIGTLVILASVDWRMLVGAFALLPATWATHKTWIGRIRPVHRDMKFVRQGMDAATTEAFGGIRVVRGFNQVRAESTRFSIVQHFLARQEIMVWWWSRMIEISWAVLIPLASAAVLVYGGTQVIRGTLTIGDVMMFSTYLLMLLGPLETLTSTAANIQGHLAGFDRVLDLLDEPTEFQADRSSPGNQPAPAPFIVQRDQVRGQLEIAGVSFAYPAIEQRKPAGDRSAAAKPAEPSFVLRDVSLSVNPGETVALVGPSGSGKTTLCNLIARFYDPTVGRILLDGRDLREIDVTSYRRLLGIVEQDVFLFDGTLAENIAYARRDAGDDDIRAAARAAHAADFIDKLEQKYDTLIGERGVRLSGGQKQRIAIARALLADPKILILDEATSNLDAESEAMIQASLHELMQRRTCFVIAHRLSTIRNANRIVVMDQGQIREVGTHDELLARRGRYADLLFLQLEGAPRSPQPGTRI